MKFHGIEMVGPLTLEILATLPAWSPQWKGRIVYVEANDTIYYGKGAYWQSIAIGDSTATISDEPYDATTWSASLDGASKRVLRNKFELIGADIDLLKPTIPDYLSAISLELVSTNNQARRANGTNMRGVVAGTEVTVVDSVAFPTPEVQSSQQFFDGDEGLLQAIVNDVSVGSRELSDADDSGTYSSLVIDTDVDYYAGQGSPKEGFWKVLTATIQNAGQLGTNDFRLSHSITGDSEIQFIKDTAPATPVYSQTGGPVFPTPTISYISGVPTIGAGDTIRYSANISNLVGECYHKDNPLLATSNEIQSDVSVQFASPPAPGATLAATINLIVANGVYSEGLEWLANMYQAFPFATPAAIETISGTNIRVDTVSNTENANYANGIEADTNLRLTSGFGQYPSSGYGTLFDPTKSLADVNYPELQQVNGKFQWPNSVNYASNLPTAGPNYIGLTGDSISGQDWRWYTRKIHTNDGEAIRSLTFTIDGAENFNDLIDSNLLIYVKVESLTGWVDANAAFLGAGSPSSNGDASLDVANSTPVIRRITFGQAEYTGDVYIRIGLPSGSNKKFTSISITETT